MADRIIAASAPARRCKKSQSTSLPADTLNGPVKPLRARDVLSSLGMILREPKFRPASSSPFSPNEGSPASSAPDPTTRVSSSRIQAPEPRDRASQSADPKSAHVQPNMVLPTALASRPPRRRTDFEPAELAKMEFRKAAELFQETNAHRLRSRTAYGYAGHVKALAVHFGGMKLDDIHIGHILAYQKDRSGNVGNAWRKLAGPSIVNHEISTLGRVLRAANLWQRVADLYTPLTEPAMSAPKTMTEVEKRRFYAVAASRPEFELALLVATITNQTTAAGTELRHLRLDDLRLDDPIPTMTIDGNTAKNNHRGRTIALTSVAVDALRECLDRAHRLGSKMPEHFVFPLRIKGTQCWDPTRPASSSWLRRAWEDLRIAAGLPWLTPHCFRHQACTELGERGTAPEVIRQLAGHTTQAMLNHYCRIRREKQAQDVAVLAKDPFGADPSKAPKLLSPAAAQDCPHCGIPCNPSLAFCPNGDILDEAKARKARPWLFRETAA